MWRARVGGLGELKWPRPDAHPGVEGGEVGHVAVHHDARHPAQPRSVEPRDGLGAAVRPHHVEHEVGPHPRVNQRQNLLPGGGVGWGLQGSECLQRQHASRLPLPPPCSPSIQALRVI